MSPQRPDGVGARIAAARRSRRFTQAELATAACVSLAMIKALERGARVPSDAVVDAIADALDLDPERLTGSTRISNSRVHAAMPAVRAVVDAYDVPEDGPVRPLAELARIVAELTALRLASRYTQLAATVPAVMEELCRAVQVAQGPERAQAAALLAAATRSADAAAYKFGHRDLSARLVELMRWAARAAQDPLLEATAAYVRMEVFFSSQQQRSLASGVRMLEAAIDAAPAPTDGPSRAAVGALHMRAAVAAGRNADAVSARTHLAHAKVLAGGVREGVYLGTAFGPSSYRIHEVAVATELGDGATVLSAAREWKPPAALPAERRSHYYIDVARAQLWQNLPDDALESLMVARRIAPQHAREHPQVQEVLRSLLRGQRSDRNTLLGFAEWAGAV